MRVLASFPSGTHKNADFVTRRSTLKKGERVVDLGVDVEDLGMHGLLCITESTVRMIVKKLGLAISEDLIEENKELLQENGELRSKLTHYEQAIGNIKLELNA